MPGSGHGRCSYLAQTDAMAPASSVEKKASFGLFRSEG